MGKTTYNSLEREFDRKVKALQNNCPHPKWKWKRLNVSLALNMLGLRGAETKVCSCCDYPYVSPSGWREMRAND